MSYKRIVVKLGTNLLTAGSNHLNLEIMTSLVGQIAIIYGDGVEVVIVSSGAITAGRHSLGLKESRDIPLRQVLAAVGQSHLMDAYEQLFRWHEITIAQALLTRTDLSSRVGYLNVRNTLSSLLKLRIIPIVNENDVTAVDEIKEAVFGDNDNLSAMVANLIDADLLMLLTDTAGLYTSDPSRDPDAKLIPCVDRIDVSIERLAVGSSNQRGTGGMTTKIEAAKMATASGVKVTIADGRLTNVIVRLAAGESLGTCFPQLTSKMESRKRWMLSQLSEGKLSADSGAVTAVRKQNKSLLPAGVTEVGGKFERGAVVNILDSMGEKVACGITNYGSKDITAIKGEKSEKIAELLGYEYGAEVVHRDNMVVL
ncbi:glutamate 5-kinase [Chloroflexota bacterium]